mmetsp:Transcript_12713/g.18111  ORF Transcript_12713/g.18111 Transcript_12713/m.18111 type:complete len:460 (-) Transcript_12713:4106-5485(-)|eukprot:CAMPEP_0184871928 /NCGR_PEP_ID=MMETSP0580-20130426/40994_1 /TAXON_ID=1118495 /ORGANISM="Dactyliosolen fragilissimus" /LENGTH=459 /DNA_ID=CAMNT_0027374647 /DNA_START=452 /DNA_END=1831 /DNA_ORIENTATION=+
MTNIINEYTVRDAIVRCGMSNDAIYQGNSQAFRIASDVFDDDFYSTMDKEVAELEDDFKSYTNLTHAQGQIRIDPGTKKNIRAYIQWSRDKIRVGDNPAAEQFPVEQSTVLIRRYKTHKSFKNKAKLLMETAKLSMFTDKVKWEDWYLSFLNFLRAIPGWNGIPLRYVCRKEEMPTIEPAAEMLDDYINRAPLNGEAYLIDAAEVHMYIVNFITGNSTTEAKILPHAEANDERLDFIALKDHYEGVGINSIDILKADNIIDTLFYSGEKKPHMWWEEYEKQITTTLSVYDRKENREVYSDEMKLRILCKKVKADFLQSVRSSISIELSRQPETLTYNQALATFRNEVNRKFPLEVSSNNTRTRRVNEVQSRNGGSGRSDRGCHSGRGGGRWNNKWPHSREGARIITGTDGKIIEVHPSYNLFPDIWNKIPEAERTKLREERQAYKRNRNSQAASIISYI